MGKRAGRRCPADHRSITETSFAGAGRLPRTAAPSPIWESAGLAGLEVASSALVAASVDCLSTGANPSSVPLASRIYILQRTCVRVRAHEACRTGPTSLARVRRYTPRRNGRSHRARHGGRGRRQRVPAVAQGAVACPDDNLACYRLPARSSRARLVRAGGRSTEDVGMGGRGAILGFIVLGHATVEYLYVEPEMTGRGIGGALLEHAKGRRPAGFCLWTFQRNEGARRFYECHGLRLIRLTDGEENEENEEKTPAALYAWRTGGRQPQVTSAAVRTLCLDRIATPSARCACPPARVTQSAGSRSRRQRYSARAVAGAAGWKTWRNAGEAG